jgi:hypothetical protein
VSLSRFAWLLTVIACLITGGAMLLEHYQAERYPAVALAVGIAAAINLL